MEDRPPHEAELIARAKRGELDAYEGIVRLHETIAFRTAWVITTLLLPLRPTMPKNSPCFTSKLTSSSARSASYVREANGWSARSLSVE